MTLAQQETVSRVEVPAVTPAQQETVSRVEVPAVTPKKEPVIRMEFVTPKKELLSDVQVPAVTPAKHASAHILAVDAMASRVTLRTLQEQMIVEVPAALVKREEIFVDVLKTIEKERPMQRELVAAVVEVPKTIGKDRPTQQYGDKEKTVVEVHNAIEKDRPTQQHTDKEIMDMLHTNATPADVVRRGVGHLRLQALIEKSGFAKSIVLKGNWHGKRQASSLEDSSGCKYCKQKWGTGEFAVTTPRTPYALICGACDSAGRTFRPERRSEASIANMGETLYAQFLAISEEKRAKKEQRLQKAKDIQQHESQGCRRKRRR